MINLLGKSNVYVKIDVSDLDTSEYLNIFVLQSDLLKWRINNGVWVTDTTTGLLGHGFTIYNNVVHIFKNDTTQITLSATDVVEIMFGKIDSISSTPSNYMNNYNYRYVVRNSIVDPFEVLLYNYSGELHQVTKTLTSPISILGQLTEECDLLDPSILVQYEDTLNPSFKYNYLYVAKFNRYYFITGITSVRNGLWRINCHVDVLMTYDSDIRTQSGFIERSESSDGTASGLVDDRIPLTDSKRIIYQVIDKTPALTTLKNVDFDFTDIANTNPYVYKYVMTTMSKFTNITGNPVISSPISALPDIPQMETDHDSVFLLDIGLLADVKNANYLDDTTASFVKSLMVIPCDLHRFFFNTDTPNDTIWAGDKLLIGNQWDTSGTASKGFNINNSASPYLILADFNVDVEQFSDVLTPELTFLNHNPNAQYELYIPFVGFVELPYEDIRGSRLLLVYTIDLSSGLGNAFVYNYTNFHVIYSSQCQIGIKIPTNTTNELEITKQKQSNLTNFALNELSSAIAMAGGVASGNVLSAIGGGMGVLKSIGSVINANNMLFKRANVSIGGSISSFYFPYDEPFWKITYRDVIDTPNSAFFSRNGYVKKAWDTLTTYTGYTEISQLHYTPSTYTFITSTEIEEIESLAEKGIIL